MNVYLAEKPSQGRDIARVLGCNNLVKKTKPYIGYMTDNNSTIVTWCLGHLVTCAEPRDYDPKYANWNIDDLPFIPDNWMLAEADTTAAKAQIKVIKQVLKQATNVIISTDADREGELIARLVLFYCGYDGPMDRLWLSALDPLSIKKALAEIKPATVYEPLFWAGLGRQRADFLCGLNYTRCATKIFDGQSIGKRRNIYSVGRVQSPTLRMIVERDREIENFTSKNFYTLKAKVLTQKNESFFVDWQTSEDCKYDDSGRCLDFNYINGLADSLKGKDGIITDFTVEDREVSPPLPFCLSDLQKKANTKYGYKAGEILKTAQTLYEKYKATTYPRSDCNYLPTSQFSNTKAIFDALISVDPSIKDKVKLCDPSIQSNTWNDKKVEKSSHHAIIPTMNANVDLNSMSTVERNVYDLIRMLYLAQFISKYKYRHTSITLHSENHCFKTTGNIVLYEGWVALLGRDYKEENQDLPLLNFNDRVNIIDTNIESKKTRPPSRFTDATLLNAMKTAGKAVEDEELKKVLQDVAGLGTEATRAEIIDTLHKRNYTEAKGKYILSTQKGKHLIQELPDRLTSVEITAKWEKELDMISKARGSYRSFIEMIENNVRSNIEELKQIQSSSPDGILTTMQATEQDFFCPDCGGKLRKFPSNNNKIFWWGCSNFKAKKCKFSARDNSGRPVLKKSVPEIVKPCPKCCKGNLVKRTYIKKGKEKTFLGCSCYPTCKYSEFINKIKLNG